MRPGEFIFRSMLRVKFTPRALRTSGACSKRSLKGTYVAVEPFHLDRYVTEQVFRFNNRAQGLNDYDRFAQAVSQIAGKRLTYAEVTGKVGETSTN